MIRGLVLALCLSLMACATSETSEESARNPESDRGPAFDLVQLQSRLGLDRPARDLGLVEKTFDGCRIGIKGDSGKCGTRVLSVINFRLRCRDSEDTVSNVATNLTPVTTTHVQWKIAGLAGLTKTDRDGFGQVQMVTSGSIKDQRLVLTVGKQFLGKEISDITELVVPNYWCKQLPSVLSKNVEP